jgi:hypothetical protein
MFSWLAGGYIEGSELRKLKMTNNVSGLLAVCSRVNTLEYKYYNTKYYPVSNETDKNKSQMELALQALRSTLNRLGDKCPKALGLVDSMIEKGSGTQKSQFDGIKRAVLKELVKEAKVAVEEARGGDETKEELEAQVALARAAMVTQREVARAATTLANELSEAYAALDVKKRKREDYTRKRTLEWEPFLKRLETQNA